MTRFVVTVLLLAAVPALPAEPPESDRELIRQEEGDRMDREKAELRDRAADLQRQLDTSREVLKKQDRLIEQLRLELKRLEQREGQAE